MLLNFKRPAIVADKDKSHSIFGAVAFYMKHLGVKTRALDNKKTKSVWRPSVPSVLRPWGGGKPSKPIKPPGINTKSTKSNPPPPRVLINDSINNSGRKSTGIWSSSVSENPDVPNIPSNVTPSPDSQIETGVNTSRLDPKPGPDGGNVSPVSTGPGLSISEPPSSDDIVVEDSQDGANVEGGLLPDGLLGGPAFGPFPQHEEIEPRLLELEQDSPNWRELADGDNLNKLSKMEIKRQEVINELFATEHAHVRMLTVLQTVFYRPLEKGDIMVAEEVSAIFPNLDEIIDMHYAFFENLKKLRQEDSYIVRNISIPLLNRFSGSEGEWFQKLTARFCSHQSWALEQIKSRQKRDPRFNAFILDAESKPQCRRLQLKDIIPIEMQRLTKYPLLLENIAKNTEDKTEKSNITQAAECCRKILNHVNDEVKQMENLLILKDYQRRLDTSGLKPSNDLYVEYKNVDLSTREMLYEGPLTWKVTKEKAIDVHCVLLSDLLVLMQKQDDKMVLKCQSKSNIAVQEGKQMLSPIIKLQSVFLRDVATDPKALYVIFTWDSGAQIYELVAQTVGERKNWTEGIKSAVDELKKIRGSGIDRQRAGSMPGSAIGPGYGPFYNPPLSPTENGAVLLKSNSARYKDNGADEKSNMSEASLIDYLAANGIDLLTQSHIPSVKLAAGALDEIISLKRLLVGSISLSDDSLADGENEGAGPESQETDGCQSSVEESSTDDKTGGQEGGGDESSKGEEERGISAPLVLSQERMEEVQRKLQVLEEQLKRLQSVEDYHYKLQEALGKYSLQGGLYN